MLEQEYSTKMVDLDERQLKMEMKIQQVDQDHRKISADLSVANIEIGVLHNNLANTDKFASNLEQNKIDEKVFNKRVNFFQNEINQCIKRLNQDEHEMQEFGEFIVRYMPLSLTNLTSDILIQCFDGRGIQNLKSYLKKQDKHF